MAFLQPGQGRGPFFGTGGERAFNVPAVIFWLIGALVAAHLARVFMAPETGRQWLERLAFVPGRVQTAPLAELPNSLAYIFLHFDATGLAIDCLMVLAFGSIAAMRFGAVKFLALFFLSGIAAAAFDVALDWGSPLGMVGSFGAVSGLVAAAVRIGWARNVPAATSPAPLVPLLSGQVGVFVILWLGLDFVFRREAVLGNLDVAAPLWQPVLGGMAAGLLLTDLFDLFVPKIALDDGYDA